MRAVFIWLMIVTVACAQEMPHFNWLNDDPGYEADAQTYFNAMATPLSAGQKTKINKLVKMLKDSLAITSLSSKFYAMYVFSNETQEAALKNLVSRNYDATAVNSPTWGDTGFVGGATKYINTAFNPVAVKADSTNFSIGAYHKGTVSAGTSQTIMNCEASANPYGRLTLGWINAGSTFAGAVAVSFTQYAPTNSGNAYASGCAVVTTNGDRSQTFYSNGTAVSPSVTADDKFAPYNIYILAANLGGASLGGFCTSINVRLAFIGKGLSATNVRAINNCIETYMDSRGHGVQP